MRYPLLPLGVPMLETFLKLLTDLPDWQVYREVASVLDTGELAAWRRLYDSNPGRDVLLREAARVLTTEVQRRLPDAAGNPHREPPTTCTNARGPARPATT